MTQPPSFRDAFPPDGLVAKYKPFILKETLRYSRHYKLPFRALIHSALSIALKAERTFDPQRAKDFSTHLRHCLQRLNRIAQSLLSARYGRPGWSRIEPSYRQRAVHAFNQCPIRWDDHRPALLDLDQRQRNSLRTYEKAILDWMIDPGGRTLTQIAEENEITKSWASKVRYRLLLKSHTGGRKKHLKK
jgi:hypothetical protein